MNTENSVDVSSADVANENTVHADSAAVVADTVADASNVAAEASVATVKAKEPKVKGNPGRPRVVGSALSRARAIYVANPSAARADIVAKFIADGISKPIANTYYHLLQKGK